MLQVKEATASVLEPHLGAAVQPNHGQRVVEGQRLMQAASDILLGWIHATASTARSATSTSASCGTGRARRRSRRWAPRCSRCTGSCAAGPSPARMPGRATASRSPPTWAGATAFDRRVASFAEAYADQNERDYAALAAAGQSGRIAVVEGL